MGPFVGMAASTGPQQPPQRGEAGFGDESPDYAHLRRPNSLQEDEVSEDHVREPEMKAGCCYLWDPSVPRHARYGTVAVIVFWLAMCPLFVLFAPKFSKATSSDFDAPKGSDSERSKAAQSAYFSRSVNNGSVVFYIEDITGGSVTAGANCSNPVCKFTMQLKADVEAYLERVPVLQYQSVNGYFLANDSFTRGQLVPKGDDSSTIVVIQLGNTKPDKMDDFIEWLKDYDTDRYLPPRTYFVGVTGKDVLSYDAGSGTMKSAEGTEKITFPIAFFVLACFIRSARLMIIPVLTICVCLGTTFSICYGVATVMDIVTIAPALMMAATLAFNVDYNLFLLTRFRENAQPVLVSVASVMQSGCLFHEGSLVLRAVAGGSEAFHHGVRRGWELVSVNGERPLSDVHMKELAADAEADGAVKLEFRMSLWENAWESVVRHTASETVLLSGTLVTIAFFAMALIPLNALYGLGICGGVSVFVCVVVNCTLSPALLLIFGDFFAGPCCTRGLSGWWAQQSLRWSSPDEEAGEALLSAEDRREKLRTSSCWYRWAEVMQRCPLAFVLVVLAAGAPLYIRFPDNLDATRINADPLEFAPRDSDSVHTWRRLGAPGKFDLGKFQPYSFITVNETVDCVTDGEGFTPDLTRSGVFSPGGYMAALSLVRNISSRTSDVPLRSFYGPTVLPVDLAAMAPSVCNATTIPIHNISFANPLACGEGYTAIDFAKVPPYERDIIFGAVSAVGDASRCTPLCAQLPMNRTQCEHDCESLVAVAHGLAEPSTCKSTCTEIKKISPEYCPTVCSAVAMYKNILVTMVSQPKHKAMTTQCFLPFQPTGLQAMEWINALQPVFADFRRYADQTTVYLTGGNAMFHDFNKTVNKDMPRMIGILLAIVFIIVVAVFRSIAIGLVMAITIIYSVGVAFGIGYYVYQTDGFHWMFPYLSDFNNQGLNWSVVPMCFAITVALAMDYDVFILTRIFELRRKGLTTADAVKEAMWGVSGTIAGAGCIMAIAFGGLILTTVVALNQFGVLLTISILIDTFLMTTIVVPATMLLLKRWSWWPGPLSKDDGSPDAAGDDVALAE
eukprot:TRINITY_DN10911_c0_g1_i1.p1 TRINITY_DN10911_c0_g1~~TRINITY_DN10911_c0_g1_i1.p1  ORF type:complete len:1090 (+),score=343.08 TRINITY_DN10911_c0_g1_i1:57-3272(+)